MFSALVEGLLSSEPVRTMWLIVLVVSCAIAFVTALPALGIMLLARDIDRALRSRGVWSDVEDAYGHLVAFGAMKMCAWVGVLVLIAHFLL
jgi:hypothetical protein